MSRLTFIVLLACASLTLAQAYGLPEVICYIESHGDEGPHGAKSFACIGDPNGDGFDDLMIKGRIYQDGEHINGGVNLLLGGEEMDAESDMAFFIERDYQGLGTNIRYHGQVNPNQPLLFSITSIRGPGPDERSGRGITY